MSDPNDVLALELISNEVDESQIKIILSSQCIKAQAFLVNKLRKQSQQRKETCNFINSGNLKLDTEIKSADQKINSSITALEIIKSANIDLKKELLLSRERKLEVIERVNTGIKKYEGIWEKSKAKYENIPFVKNFLQTKNESLTLRENINILIEESQKALIEINKKKIELTKLDRKLLLEVADYFVNEKPKILLAIIDKTAKIKNLDIDIKALIKDHSVHISSETETSIAENKELNIKIHDGINVMENSWLNLNRNSAITLPKLQLCDIDLDVLTVKLDQFKRDDILNPIKTKRTDIIVDKSTNDNKRFKPDDFHEELQSKDDIENVHNRTKNYSGMKLIHILDDIKLDKLQSCNLLAKIKPGELQDINIIKAATTTFLEDDGKQPDNEPDVKLEKDHYIEEIDLTTKHPTNVLVPPTQFSDSKEYTEEVNIIPVGTKAQDFLNIMQNQENKLDVGRANEAMDNQINVSIASDESFNKMKDIIFKKHNLDLSPQFTYSKKPILKLNPVDGVVTSKFFDRDNFENKNRENNKIEPTESGTTDKDTVLSEAEYVRTETNGNPKDLFNNIHDTKIRCSSPIPEVNENTDADKLEVPVSGFLFNHGPGTGIPESLDVSMSTTGYEECDADYPQCIDSSLLMSPKAYLPEGNENNVHVLSQDVPNFLSGLRKSGFSFFGSTSNQSSNKSEAKNNDSNFNFAFGGGEEKKTRGGLFSMFK